MEKELKKLFLNAKLEGNVNLAQNIWNSIAARNKRIARLKLWAFSSVSLASLIGFIPAWHLLSNDLAQSGIYEYLSLAFSNGSPFFAYWKEFVLSIAESLPTISITLSLSLVFIFFLSLKFATKQIIRGQLILSV